MIAQKNEKRKSKKAVYAGFGIEYANGKINAPEFGYIPELLIDGNSKLGKGVWTFSTLAGTKEYHVNINGKEYTIKGTCICNCVGCYAMSGFYNMPSVILSNAIKTYLCRYHLEFVKNAIIAQIKAMNIRLCRIHASGEFFNSEYVEMWRDVITKCKECAFWTYTKNKEAENAFSELPNANIVKSIISGFGFNFGKCSYILMVYKALKEAGKSVYICKCGIDKNQHCTNCKGCSKNDYVLFIEHSTDYRAELDPAFNELKDIIEKQADI